MSGRSRRWLALIGVTVLVALLRPPVPPAKPRPDRPRMFSWPWHKVAEEALLEAEAELQEALRGAGELDRPSDPDRLAVMPGVTFLLRVTERDAFELVALEWDPVSVDVTADTATTIFRARIRVKVDGVEIAGRERHTHRWIQDGDTWRLAEADVAVFADVP
jgi:hypothetical protein